MSEMSLCWQRRVWKLWLASWLVGGAIASSTNCAVAQITPDTTLPNNSRVTPDGNTSIIEGGTQAGGNLFHSFAQFSVPTGSSAHFNNAADVQNIISRVRGGSVSNIDGLISANGTANLFLINPSGIVFGANASLNIGGSFVASTASSLKFADGSQFSATPAQSAPLLTISVPIGLQYGANPGSIQVQGNGQGLRSTTELIDTTSGFLVQPNQTLALVGGDVSLEGATLKTAGGRIELGSVTGVGLVSLTPISKGFSLGYDQVQNFGNIQLSQQTAVDSSGEGGGDIQVWGKSVTLTNGSQIEASTLGVEQGGNLVVNAQDSVQLIGISADKKFPSGLFANAYPSVTGAAGNLTINTRELLVRDGGQVSASTDGAGNAGNLTVRADSVQLIGTSSIDPQFRSTLLSETYSTGAAGNLTINTRELLVRDGAYVGARTYSAGNAGNLTVNANSVQLTGNSPRGAASALIVTSEEGATGAAGNLTINTSKLSLEDGAQVSAGTWGPLKGGNLTVTADSVQVIGIGTSSLSSLNTNAFQTASGAAGNLTINTRELLVRDGGQVSTSNDGAGNGGNLTVRADSVQLIGESSMNSYSANGNGGDINILAGSLDMKNGAALSTSTYRKGDAGSVNINDRDTVSFDQSYVFTSVETGAEGKAGNINITAGSLDVKNGAFLSVSTFGKGDAGDINIIARDTVSFYGIGGSRQSIAYSTVEQGAVGNAGDINITTGSLFLTDIAYLTTQTDGLGNSGSINIQAEQIALSSDASLRGDVSPTGRGRGGNINLDVKGKILLTGASSFFDGESTRITIGVLPGGIGSGGDIKIKAGSVVLTDGAIIKNSNQGQGNAGNIWVNADVVDISGSVPNTGLPSGLFTSTETTANDAGNIFVDTRTFRIADGAALSARSKGNGQGGNLRVNATTSFEALNGGQLVTTTFGQGKAGNIFVNATDRVTISGSDPNYTNRIAKFPSNSFFANNITETGAASGLFANTESNSTGQGGNITVSTNTLSVRDGKLLTSTSGNGQAGDITVNAKEIQLSGSISGLFAQTSSIASAGNLTLQPYGSEQTLMVNLLDEAQISASTFGSGSGGKLLITAPESITLNGNGSIISAETTGKGAGGDLTLRTGKLTVQNGAQVTVSSANSGIAGSLIVEADSIRLDNGAKISADTRGGGGNIDLRSPLLVLRRGSSITTKAQGSNIPGGNITIDALNGFIVAVPKENSDISADSADFRGGNVSIKNVAGIFGIQFRKEPSPQTSDITATGASPELSGTVEINTLDIDPNTGLVNLPTVPVDTRVAQGCYAGGAQAQSKFIITGRGGLPPNPKDVLTPDTAQIDWVSVKPSNNNRSLPPVTTKPTTATPKRIIEATGAMLNAKGQIVLTANSSTVTPRTSKQNLTQCHGS